MAISTPLKITSSSCPRTTWPIITATNGSSARSSRSIPANSFSLPPKCSAAATLHRPAIRPSLSTGPRFPVTTIRDNVEAVHHLLVDELKVTHLRAIIGFSMGAEQAFQWAVSYPAFTDRIVATSGTAKCYPQGFIRLESQINAIELDPAFNNGDYTKQPSKRRRSLRLDLDRVALFSGMVARRTLARRRETRHNVRINCSKNTRPTSSPAAMPTTSFSRCAPGSATTSAPQPASTAT